MPVACGGMHASGVSPSYSGRCGDLGVLRRQKKKKVTCCCSMKNGTLFFQVIEIYKMDGSYWSKSSGLAIQNLDGKMDRKNLEKKGEKGQNLNLRHTNTEMT